ncbi:hypothetical protein SPI_03653 [Niveomyces insectorum RCEF 264]|uniref:Uncharacterized protein n=1 Tax=Niveomyces insectorum RCEF 264 TaxID=1081102 RepID=A0A162MKZ4_9HYPO|nr:hypothetical protein SPI_03653 [Niveomyces insectorum RCEF 264]
MADPYFNQVTSVAALANILRRERKESLGELYRAPNTTMPSASNWDRTHLLACRVLIKNPTNSPAILPLIRDHALPQDQNWPPYIANFLNGPPPGFANSPEHQLIRACEPSWLGSLWYALARFHRSGDLDGGHDSRDDASDDIPLGRRSRVPAAPPTGFVSSSTIRAGSSSPMDERSDGSDGSSSEPASLFTSDQVHGGASPHEDATIHFAHLCLSYVLNYGPPQDDPRPGQPLQLNQLRPRHLVAMSNKKRLYHGHIKASNWTAIDDGGLELQFWDPQLHALSEGLANPRVCHIEAKSRFRVFVDDKPVPSDLALAQMAGQAIAISQGTRKKEYGISAYLPKLLTSD